MANIFKPKRSTTASSVPTTGDLVDGELAVNIADQKIYLRNGDSVVEVANAAAGGGGGLSNVVEDTTPQLGGDLDLNNSNITGTGNVNITGVSTFQGDANVTGNLAVDANTLFVNATNNRIGIGTTNPAYQVEIENTGANALLVLDRTDGAACFIEGQATRSAFGSVNETPLALAYNSFAVVTIGAGGSIRVNPDGDGYTFPTTDGSANQVLQTDGAGNISFATVSGGGISNYAKYTGTGTPNVNGSTAYNEISWINTTPQFSNGTWSATASAITVPNTGLYLVQVNWYLTGTVTRSNVGIRFAVNDATEDEIAAHNYIRSTSNHNESSANMATTLSLTAGDEVSIYAAQLAAAGTVNLQGANSTIAITQLA